MVTDQTEFLPQRPCPETGSRKRHETPLLCKGESTEVSYNVGPDVVLDLEDIQGNILHGYRRTRLTLMFVRFNDDHTEHECRQLLRDAVTIGGVTSATDHAAFRGEAKPLTNLMLTAEGLRRIGHGDKLQRMDPRFRMGSRAPVVVSALQDRPVETWEPTHQPPWHAVYLAAHNAEPGVDGIITSIHNVLANESTHIETGNTLDSDGNPVSDPYATHYEPFGFRDGLSNPVFDVARKEDELYRSVDVVLASDPLSNGGLGTYFVFRKLQQNAARFNELLDQYVQEALRRARTIAGIHRRKYSRVAHDIGYGQAARIARQYAKDPEKAKNDMRDFILRRAMGRDRNGHPYTEWDQPAQTRAFNPYEGDNNFTYDQPGQRACPLTAHVRKMNPRGGTGTAEERRHVIVRRSMPYGTPTTGAAGLLFLCAQSDIAMGFEHLQRAWANDDPEDPFAQPRPTPGFDNLIAQPPSSRARSEDTSYGTAELQARFYECVELQAAEYFFAPSIGTILAL